MIVFLVGGESRLMDDLITKMEKEGHKTYLLTGKRDRRGKYRRVFERYDFPYDSESVQEIFSNVNPDLVLFLGAYDTNYDWSDARKESVRYTADLTNILSAYAFKQDGRFIYLSSEAVYGRSYSSDIHETEPASAKSFQAMALLQGENICRSYRDTRGMDTRILRFDHMYGIPRKGKTDRNPCFWMTLEMLKTNQIAANSRTVFSMIYQDDAVAFAYRAMMEESPKYPLYHITSGEAITQMDLAELIRQNADGVEIRDDTVGEGFRLVLDGSRYQEEFDGRIFVPYEKGVKAVVTYMQKHSSLFLQRDDAGGGLGKPGMESVVPDFPYAGSVHRKSDLFYPIFYDQQPCSRQPVFFKAGCVPSLCVAVCHRIWSAAGDFLGPAGDCGLLFPPDVPSERTGGADGLQYLHLDGTAFYPGNGCRLYAGSDSPD